jgi:hypothetical protein
VNFPFQGTGSNAEIEVVERVIATGAETVKSYTTHYTVSGGSGSTGTVTAVSPPASTVQWHIRRTTTRTQTVDYTANDPFPAETHELALDRLAMSSQEIQEELGRAIKVSRTNSITTPEFVDDASTRASKLLGFSSDGNTLEATTGRVNTVTVSNVSVDGSGNSQDATVSYNSTTGALALGVPVGSTGATGSTGSQGPDGVGGLPYTFSTTTTDSDPGAGQIRLNNGTLGSVSEIYIDDSTAASGNPDVSAFLLTWDDSTQTSDRGQVTITKKSAQENFATYKISGASTDASGYVKLAVTHVVSNGSFSNSDAVLVSFVRTGNAGSLADPMTTRGDLIIRDASNATARLAIGSANTVLKSDGTDASWGYTVGTSANNLVQLDGSAKIPAVDGSQVTGINLQGKHSIFIPAAAMRPTSSNGCAAITDVETTAGRPDMQVLDFDASADEHAQFQIAMPKQWNEGAITFQVYWCSTATDTDGVTWGLQGVACSDSDTIDVAYGTAVTVDDANLSAAEDLCVSAESGAVTIAGSPAAGDMTFFRIFRDVSDSNDTAAEDARLIGVKIFLTTNAGNDA